MCVWGGGRVQRVEILEIVVYRACTLIIDFFPFVSVGAQIRFAHANDRVCSDNRSGFVPDEELLSTGSVNTGRSELVHLYGGKNKIEFVN